MLDQDRSWGTLRRKIMRYDSHEGLYQLIDRANLSDLEQLINRVNFRIRIGYLELVCGLIHYCLQTVSITLR